MGMSSTVRKNGSLVDYPIEAMDMREHVITLKDEPEPVLYDLYAVTNHYGDLGGGHYTAICKSSIDQKWYNFNDSCVSPAAQNEIVTSAAYLLWYRKRE